MVSQSRPAISSAIVALTWAFKLSQTTTMGPPSCWCAAPAGWCNRLGEALALAGPVPAASVSAVDQPGPAPGLDGDQRGRGQARAVAGGHLHDRGVTTAAPGAAFRRP